MALDQLVLSLSQNIWRKISSSTLEKGPTAKKKRANCIITIPFWVPLHSLDLSWCTLHIPSDSVFVCFLTFSFSIHWLKLFSCLFQLSVVRAGCLIGSFVYLVYNPLQIWSYTLNTRCGGIFIVFSNENWMTYFNIIVSPVMVTSREHHTQSQFSMNRCLRLFLVRATP